MASCQFKDICAEFQLAALELAIVNWKLTAVSRQTSATRHRTTSAAVVVWDPHASNQSIPSLTRSNLSA
jgi:hypothetical protein